MRLSTDDVLTAIVHTNPTVRHLALNYFTCSFCNDPRVMPAFIQAVERYGWETSAALLRSTATLLQTEETVRWLLDQCQASDSDEGHLNDLECVLVYSRGAVLRPYAAEISGAATLSDDLKAAVADSIALSELAAEELWRRLEDFCGPIPDDDDFLDERMESGALVATPDEEPSEALDDEEIDDEEIEAALAELEPDHDHLTRLCRELAAHTAFVSERVRAALKSAVKPDSTSWRLPEYAARIAREARLLQTASELVELLSAPSEFLSEDAQDALAAIGSDSAIELLRAKWPTSDIAFRLTTLTIFEATHTDRSVEVALSLAEPEDDAFTKEALLGLALRSFDSRAVEVVRRYLSVGNHGEELVTLRTTLAAVCEMMKVEPY
ncbi:MAG: hypothetical protein C0467_05515 [Planctomycetaceae bacterium]|nr:hypothetical protein [Planctomycetaceae bacterium]